VLYIIYHSDISQLSVPGISSGAAAGHAYIADCASPATRSRYLSLSMGLLFVGIAIGPTIGGLLISKTGDLLIVYYLAASLHFFYLVSVLLIVPESLSKDEMVNNRAAHAEKSKRELEEEQRGGNGFWYWCRMGIKRAFFFLKPLTVFLPRKRAGTLNGRNWNLTYLMIAYSFVALSVVRAIIPPIR
jgi:MFS family permease